MNEDWDDFLRFTSELGIELNQNQLRKFQAFHHLLLDWNKKINLVSRKDIHRIVSYHFIDSLACLSANPVRFIPESGQVCDLGAGAGLPGIPVKIVREELSLYLVESVKKKSHFLTTAVGELNLDKTNVINRRAEELTDIRVDVVIARLLGRIKDIVSLGLPLLKTGGRFLIYKSASADEELKEAKTLLGRLKGRVETIQTISLPGSGISRRIVSIIKS
jgi:16S rRNA (guanine527-N7)-methyltransferase